MTKSDITAKLNHLRISPRKVRVVADLIRGAKVEKAVRELKFLTKRASSPIKKLIESAMANAENNFNVKDKNNLYVKEVSVDEGPTLKRIRPRARGSAFYIKKRTSHISLVLAEQVEKIKGQKSKTQVKSKK